MIFIQNFLINFFFFNPCIFLKILAKVPRSMFSNHFYDRKQFWKFFFLKSKWNWNFFGVSTELLFLLLLFTEDFYKIRAVSFLYGQKKWWKTYIEIKKFNRTAILFLQNVSAFVFVAAANFYVQIYKHIYINNKKLKSLGLHAYAFATTVLVKYLTRNCKL